MDDVETLISLTRTLHLSDLRVLISPSSSALSTIEKSEQAAFKLYAAELEEVERFERDRRMARSFDVAVGTDGELIGVFQEGENRARRDHEIALVVERGGQIPRTEESGTPARRAGDLSSFGRISQAVVDPPSTKSPTSIASTLRKAISSSRRMCYL